MALSDILSRFRQSDAEYDEEATTPPAPLLLRLRLMHLVFQHPEQATR